MSRDCVPFPAQHHVYQPAPVLSHIHTKLNVHRDERPVRIVVVSPPPISRSSSGMDSSSSTSEWEASCSASSSPPSPSVSNASTRLSSSSTRSSAPLWSHMLSLPRIRTKSETSSPSMTPSQDVSGSFCMTSSASSYLHSLTRIRPNGVLERPSLPPGWAHSSIRKSRMIQPGLAPTSSRNPMPHSHSSLGPSAVTARRPVPSISRTASPDWDRTPRPTQFATLPRTTSSSRPPIPALSPPLSPLGTHDANRSPADLIPPSSALHPSSPSKAKAHPSSSLVALEDRSRFRVRNVCAVCQRPGSNYPSCPRCAETWCSRECRLSSGNGKKHVCVPKQ